MRLAGLLLLIGLVAGGGAKAEEAPVVVASVERVPLAYLDNGKPAGLAYEIVAEAFRRMNRPLDFRLMPWPRCVAELRSGGVDAAMPLFRTPERDAAFAFTDVPVLQQTMVLFVKKDSPLVFNGDLSVLSGKRIGLVYQTSYGQKLDKALKGKLANNTVTQRSVADLLMMLAHGRIDVMPGDRGGITGAAVAAGLSDQIREVKPPVDITPGYLAFTKIRDQSEVVQSFNYALRSMKSDGTYAAILKKYPNP